MGRHLGFTVGLVCLFVASFFCGVVNAEAESEEDTLEFFTPKIDLGNIRFAYACRRDPKIELSNEQVMLQAGFEERFPKLKREKLTEQEYEEVTEMLSRRQQRFVFDRITEWRGQRYCLFFPDRLELGLFRLEGIALKPTGDGGLYGFWGRLKHVAGADFREAGPADYCGQPLAFPCHTLRGHARPMHKEIADPNSFSALLPTISEHSELEAPLILKCTEFYLKYPSEKGYLVHVQGDKIDGDSRYQQTVLYCLAKIGAGFQLVPFPDDGMTGSEKDGGWLLDMAKEGPSYDLTPYDSKVYVLPDMDGDGGCEIYVVSTVSSVFRVVQEGYSYKTKEWHHRIKLVTETYFGP